MCFHPSRPTTAMLLTADELAPLSETERRILLMLIQTFTADELAVLTDEDFEYFLGLEHDNLPDISDDEAQQIAPLYRSRIQAKMASSSEPG
ncbi:MAG TPA: hypothetical protein VLA19_17385 [Herpetosiphonaceae bacterium]|nr:hypothetical protein [Herpetosiphonaceae bacterium]